MITNLKDELHSICLILMFLKEEKNQIPISDLLGVHVGSFGIFVYGFKMGRGIYSIFMKRVSSYSIKQFPLGACGHFFSYSSTAKPATSFCNFQRSTASLQKA